VKPGVSVFLFFCADPVSYLSSVLFPARFWTVSVQLKAQIGTLSSVEGFPTGCQSSASSVWHQPQASPVPRSDTVLL